MSSWHHHYKKQQQIKLYLILFSRKKILYFPLQVNHVCENNILFYPFFSWIWCGLLNFMSGRRLTPTIFIFLRKKGYFQRFFFQNIKYHNNKILLTLKCIWRWHFMLKGKNNINWQNKISNPYYICLKIIFSSVKGIIKIYKIYKICHKIFFV